MIRVILVSPATGGEYAYRIEGSAAGQGAPLTGCASDPLFDACRMLKRMGEPLDTIAGLCDEGSNKWRMRTSVGYGSREPEVPMPNPVPYREFPGGPVIPPPNAGMPATPAAPPPPPRTLPELSDEADPGYHPHPHKPATSGKSHHKRKRAGSGGRRGLSSGR